MASIFDRGISFELPTFAEARASRLIRMMLFFVAATASMLPITSVAMINSAYLALSGDLNTDFINLGCLVASYIMILAFVRRHVGVLFFMLGFRKTVLYSILLMAGASVGAAFADSFPMLVLFFIIESFAASTFFCSVPGPLVTMLVPLKHIPLHVSLVRLCIGVSSNVSPILGGILVSFFTWHSLFLLNALFAIPCLIFCFFLLPDHKAKPELLSSGPTISFFFFLGGILLSVSYGQTCGWLSTEIVCMLFVACASLILLLVNCCFGKHPLFEISLYRKKGAFWALFAAILLTVCNVGMRVQSILFMRNVLRYHPFDIAMTFVLPFCFFVLCGIPAAIVIASRNLAKPFIITGLSLEALSGLLLSHLDAGCGWPQLALPLALRSAGFAVGTVAATPFILRCFSPQEASKALLATSAPRIFFIGLINIIISPVSVLLNQWYFSRLSSVVTDASPYMSVMLGVWSRIAPDNAPLTLAVNEVHNLAQVFTYDHLFLLYSFLALAGVAFACLSIPSAPCRQRSVCLFRHGLRLVRKFLTIHPRSSRVPPTVALLVLLPFLNSCSLGPEYRRPHIDLPPKGAAEPGPEYETSQWWTVFHDPILNRLIPDALAHNFSLEASEARARAMLARAGIAGADRLPQIDASASEGTRMVTEGNKNMHHYPSRWQDSYSETASVHFNLDLWGKYLHLHAAQKARARAARAVMYDLRISTAAATARTWFRLLQLKESLAINRAMYESYGITCRIYENRVRAGLSPELHLRRFLAEQENTASQIQALEKQISSCQGNLAMLCGWTPARLARDAARLGEDNNELGFTRHVPAQIPSDIPASLMRRRPDIQGAEELLIAANENVRAAIADFFPQLSLTVDEGFSSASLEKVLAPTSSLWNVVLSPALSLFSGGHTIAAKEEAKERYREALADYKRTVSDAFRAMRDAIDNNRLSRERFESKKRQVQALLRSNYLLEKQYKVGIISVMDLLDVRRQLQAAQLEESQARLEVYFAVIAICKELGGGWENEDANDTEKDSRGS